MISTLITDAFPNDYATDGSVSYQRIIQRVLKEMGSERKVIVFPPMVYRFEDASGLSLPSNTTLLMYGAVFLLSEDFQEDGQVFHGRDVKNLSFMGGEILGRRDAWAENTNVRGIHITGRSCDILIRDMIFRDLSSNAIGIFGISSKERISHVRVQNIRTIRCSTIYRDYLEGFSTFLQKHNPPLRTQDPKQEKNLKLPNLFLIFFPSPISLLNQVSLSHHSFIIKPNPSSSFADIILHPSGMYLYPSLLIKFIEQFLISDRRKPIFLPCNLSSP